MADHEAEKGNTVEDCDYEDDASHLVFCYS